jgi:hypothetical protein
MLRHPVGSRSGDQGGWRRGPNEAVEAMAMGEGWREDRDEKRWRWEKKGKVEKDAS